MSSFFFICHYPKTQTTKQPKKMASKKTTSRPHSNTDARVALTNASVKLAKAIDDMHSRKNEFDSITSEAILDLDTKRVAAEQALEEDLLKLETNKKRKAAELDIDLQQQKRETAIKILEATNEVPVLSDELEKLRSKVEQLEEQVEDAKASTEQAVTSRLNTQHKHEIEKLKLENAATTAELTERNKSLVSMIEEKDKIIQSQRADNQQLQQLVQGVADASRPNVYGNGYSGKQA